MPTWNDLFGQRPALLVQGWTAVHEYSADLIAAYPAWATPSAGNGIVQFLSPDGFSDIFSTIVFDGAFTDAVEPDWASVPNIGDEISDDALTWNNCGPLSGFPPILAWQANHDYQTPTQPTAGVTPTTANNHAYVALPPFTSTTSSSGAVEPTFATDGDLTGDFQIDWLDMGVILYVSARVSVAFSAGPLEAFPEWTSLDATDNLITGHQVTRGRQDTFDRTGTGTATIGFADTQGILDPTNTSGPYYNSGNFIDGKQAAIALQNPVTGEWSTIFRGLIDDIPQDIDISQRASFGEIQLVDGLDYLAGCILNAGDSQETPPNAGDVVMIRDTDLVTVNYRLNYILDKKLWPAELRDINTGNVRLERHVYTTGTPALNVIDDACDAEFPGIANRYISKDGLFTFQGRLARFRALTDPEFGIQQWKAGDGAAIADDSSYAQIRSLSFSRPKEALINDALFTPQGIADGDIDSCHVTDDDSIEAYGRHSKVVQDLVLYHDNFSGNNAVDQCIEFGSFWVASRKDPKTRVTQISFKSLHPDDERAPAVWRLMCGVEISDIIILKTGTVQQMDGTWVGGFDDVMHFVEGIQYTILPLTPEYDNVTLTLQLTPLSDFVYAPWESD